jgi:hypothetical protein
VTEAPVRSISLTPKRGVKHSRTGSRIPLLNQARQRAADIIMFAGNDSILEIGYGIDTPHRLEVLSVCVEPEVLRRFEAGLLHRITESGLNHIEIREDRLKKAVEVLGLKGILNLSAEYTDLTLCLSGHEGRKAGYVRLAQLKAARAGLDDIDLREAENVQ